MTRKVIQVALNGVTGRMGYRQHLVRSLLAIREQGGIRRLSICLRHWCCNASGEHQR